MVVFDLPEEGVDFEGCDNFISVAVHSLESGEGLEVWDAG